MLFAQRCAGCHTLQAAGTQGSGTRAVRAQGPNLDQRKETYADVLFAIRNGGFSGAIMPQNIVVGDDAKAVAQFLAKYSGKNAKSPPRPGPSNRQRRPLVLDLKRIRDDPDAAGWLWRAAAPPTISTSCCASTRRRELLPEIEERPGAPERANDAIAEAKREGGDAEAAIAEMREVAAEVKDLEAELAEVEARDASSPPTLPNLPHPDAPMARPTKTRS